ncbi:hypothetical protein [Lamprobacter modestohalophilus]|uniref:hypothetical protein n=1 Tax=Lamprobacter modestohalophilus TaxID=1064514 RepID=UPI001903D959|nr:hypothetical protein [Lamprobacter modestohalophilus]
MQHRSTDLSRAATTILSVQEEFSVVLLDQPQCSLHPQGIRITNRRSEVDQECLAHTGNISVSIQASTILAQQSALEQTAKQRRSRAVAGIITDHPMRPMRKNVALLIHPAPMLLAVEQT